MPKFAKKIVLDRSSSSTMMRSTEWRDMDGNRTCLRGEHTPKGVLWAKADGTFDLINHALSPLEYRFYLTYFDQIDIPVIPPIQYWFIEPEWAYLHDVEFLTHSVIGDPKAFELEPVDEVIPDFINAPMSALEKHAQEEPGVWSFSADYRGSLDDRKLINDGSLEVQIMNLLPIPSPENSFPDIIGYRQRYRDELLKLRTSIHTLYQRVLSDPDLPRSFASVAVEINKAVEDVTKSMKGVGMGSMEISLRTELDLRTVTTGAAAFGYLTAHHMPALLSIPLAGAAALLSIKPKKADKKVLINNCPVDFSYVAGFGRYLNR